jgi:alkyldihydroxyacetonephosphate synthase
MRRWNGWGDEATDYPLPQTAARYLAGLIGEGAQIRDATLKEALVAIHPSSLPSHSLISTDPAERLRHARGQSLPDWIALRGGRIENFPDGVAHPTSDQDVQDLLVFANKSGAHLIPYGGGTSVVGHINPLPSQAPVLTLDLSDLNHLLDLDETSRLATLEAGATGPEIERQLGKLGFTLGHFPQSFEYSTLGGWIATRSSGQQSHFYGRIEDLFAGGHVETPRGALDLPPHPASAAGPDLRQLLLGSEGRLGIVTRAVMRVRPQPRRESFQAYFFHTWESATAALRQLAQSDLSFSMARLSDAQETETTLALSGKEGLVKWAGRGLRLLRYGEERCLLLVAYTYEKGNGILAQDQQMAAEGIIKSHRGLGTGNMIGEMWRKTRFHAPYLRNSLWEAGYALDTLETAVPWKEVLATAEAVKSALRNGLVDENERTLVFAHISAVYNTGASLYVTYLFRRSADPDQTLERWCRLKNAASQTIFAHGGTISHQHGVGLDHAPYLAHEKGPLGLQILETVCQTLDPDGLLNPGKLLEG